MRPHPYHPSTSGFTILEVMIAAMILAVGISAAIGTIVNNNNYRKNLDENSLADLVLRQMAARLKTTNIQNLGHVYAQTPNAAAPTVQVAQGWTLHLRATASTNVPAAVNTAAALTQPYLDTNTYAPPYRPLTQNDLIDAGILSEAVGLNKMEMYVEYYNLSTVTGLQNINGMLVPIENGLIKLYNDIQDANPTGTPNLLWYSLVGDPDIFHRTPPTPLSPTYLPMMDNLIMPAAFSLLNVDQVGTTDQLRGAFNHGLVIRILISWIPGTIAGTSASATSTANYRQWRETLIVKRD